MPTIVLQGEPVAYSLRESRRAKRVIITLSPERGLEVVYPAGQRHPPPEDVLRNNADWIISSLRRSEAVPGFSRRYAAGEQFLVRGQPYALALRDSQEPGMASAFLREDELEVCLPALPNDSIAEVTRQVVIGFYRRLAHVYLPGRLDELAAEHGFRYNRLRIKHQKTRWGSCSAKRNINLNLRLMMAADEAIDYVILHELCHLRHFNHSPAFWHLVEKCCPEYRVWRDWLKRNRAQLIL